MTRVTVCQIDCRHDRLEEAFTGLVEHVRKSQSQFVLLPEMCFSEWLCADPEPDVARWNRAVAAHSAWLERISSLHAEAVVGTRPITLTSGSRRNEAYLWTAETGPVAIHQKYHLPDEEGYFEHRWYDRGPRLFEIARALDMRIGVQICTEMWFFEWARHYAASRADLLCVPRATPHGSVRKWLAGGQVAAVCSGAYCLSSNLWAPEGHKSDCGGLGWVVDPEGSVLAETSIEEPYATVEVNLDFSRLSKRTYPRYVPE